MNNAEHLLTCLAEEGCEIAHACHKSLRFGLDDRNVLNPNGPTNRERIVEELNDLMAVIGILQARGVIPDDWQSWKKQGDKDRKVERFMDYAKKHGALKE